MNRIRIAAFSLCFGLLSWNLQADATPEQLVQQLSSARFSVRENASTVLEQLGEKALPALIARRNQGDPESVKRIDSLINRIQKNSLLTPRLVTLNHIDSPIALIVQDLEKQSQYKVKLVGNDLRHARVQLENVPFWQALDTLMSQGGLALEAKSDEELTLIPNDVYSPHRVISGPFRVTAMEFRSQRNLPLHQLPRNPVLGATSGADLWLHLEVLVEPRIGLISAGTPKIDVAEDERGRSLIGLPDVLPNRMAVNLQSVEPIASRSIRKMITVPLSLPDRKSDRLVTLKGSIPLTLLVQSEPERVIDRLTERKQHLEQIGHVEWMLDEVQQVGSRWQVSMKYRSTDALKQLDPIWVSESAQRMEISDPLGRRFTTTGEPSVLNVTPDSVHLRYEYHAPDLSTTIAPSTLKLMKWQTWTHSLEFELKDIPLP
jgi:hypothetical protein